MSRYFLQFAKRSAEDELAALLAATRTDLDEIVRCAHHGFIVFNNEQRVAFVAQSFHDSDQASDVARMQADARFIENEQRVHERRTEARREIHTLQLTAAQRASLTIQIQVTQSGAFEIAKPRCDLITQHARGLVVLADRPR